MDKIAALKRTALFGELDEKALGALASLAVERRFARDEVLFIAGDEARGLYVVVEGAVRAFRESEDGREHPHTVFHPAAGPRHINDEHPAGQAGQPPGQHGRIDPGGHARGPD